MRLDGSNLTVAYNTTSLGQPLYLYVDSYENIYVTFRGNHGVFVFRPNSTNGTRIAGSRTAGSANEQFNWPYGIFVSDNGTIYVADHSNNQIMKWLAGASSGIRVAGDGTSGYSLTQVNSPTDVIVDEDEFMYITEAIGSRITRWAPHSSYGTCIVACSGTTGTGPNQLHQPHSLAFDSFGSLYVSEWLNNRVQKFELLNYPVPYNQPNLDSNATWSQCGVTFIDKTTSRSFVRGFFIDSNDTLYLVDYVSSRILIWHDHTTYPSRELSATLFEYTGLFVTLIGDIFFQNGIQTGRIDKFSSNSNTSQFVTMFSGNCYSLFVDIRNTLYCSLHGEHRVVTASLSDNNRSAVTIAGTSSAGPQSDQLWYPWGIFVDIGFSLYVAEHGNDRIQLFRRGERSGTTVAGKNIPNGLLLKNPTDVVLDGNGFLYIADNKNNRIIRVGDGDFECITGCAKIGGSASNQLNLAYSLRLDSVGNLYVADEANRRVQRFRIESSSDGSAPNSLLNILISFEERNLPTIKFIPSGERLRFRHNQGFHISSKIDLQDGLSEPFSSRWWILNCSSICSNQTNTNLHVPSRSLSYGLYRFKLTVTLTNCPTIESSSFIDIEITPPNIITNLVSYETRIARHNYGENLILNPGKYSYDQNSVQFNQYDWYYEYYCRIYSSNLQEFETFESANQACLLGEWIYNDANQSSVTIFHNALQLNQTYQFMVQMLHRRNFSLQSFGYLIVQVENLQSPVIIIQCLITTMCALNDEFYYVNRHTQFSLSSFCLNNCSQAMNSTWNVYRRTMNTSNTTTQWDLFTPLSTSSFFGINTTNLLVMKDVLIDQYWRFEVIYGFQSGISRSTFDVEFNDGPRDGFYGIKEISIYGKVFSSGRKIYSQRQLLLTSSTNSVISLRLPTNTDLLAQIRDTFGCVTEVDLTSVTITSNSSLIGVLFEEKSNIESNIILLSELLNEISRNIVDEIFVTPFHSDLSNLMKNQSTCKHS
ncbi:unnamed protein product [Adineta ricciae]|uniref:PKD/REJ-like domain-containing protein n=1 Tax=Adineta ricciae TaxID=249248 RepID=A0A815A162_ADIRI|nr:unnamed protein product [Adineta ricciae]